MSTAERPTPSLLIELIEGWVRTQRWFPAKGEPGGKLRVVSNTDLPDPLEAAVVSVLILSLERASGLTLLQVPLVAVADDGARMPGMISHLGGGQVLVDGPHHPAFVRAWLAAAEGEVLPRLIAGAGESRVLTGEQSNTSVLLPGDGGATMLKVFRVLSPGPNPEIEVSRALAGAGWRHVPQPLGWLVGRWPDPHAEPGAGRPQQGHLGVLNAFVPQATDGFELACAYAREGRDFATLARELGTTTADMHEILRVALPVHDARAPEARAADLAAAMRARARWALAEVPDLAPHAARIEDVIAAVGALDEIPGNQRIHGDLHLGQVLRSAEPGSWFVLDFEGEPLRPLAERTRPDQPLRDLAGMLRSIDYAAAVGPAADPRWATTARDALIGGYIAGGNSSAAQTEASDGDRDLHGSGTLVRALELDKALYEAVYEQHNRPDWLPIPIGGIRRLIEEHAMTDNARTTGPSERTGAPGSSATGPEPSEADVTAGTPSPPAAPAAERPSGTDATPSPPAAPAAEGPSGTDATPSAVSLDVLGAVAHGVHFAPHDILGGHRDPATGVVTIRTVRHLAERVAIITSDDRHEATHEHEGVWVVAFRAGAVPDYRVEVTYHGSTAVVDDPYRFLPSLGEVDQHLILEGRHERLWEVLGAHVRRYPSVLGQVTGVSFSVWAPNARAVRVVGDFNGWDGSSSSMRSLGSTGVWEVFLPHIGKGARYKFEICYSDGSWHTKADPMARATEIPPATASVVTESEHEWADGDWMAARPHGDPHTGPMSVYEVHLGSWRKGLSYRELAEELVQYVTWMNFTHVELMPVAEHPFGGSWGYQVTSYYAPTSRFGSPDDFKFLVDSLHRAGVGVILDWVPGHFPKDEWALARFDGTPLYEHPDPMRGEQQDWGTYVFDFGRNEVRNFLVANAVYWLSEFHIDGLRVDAVASMLYLDYSRQPGQWRPNVRGGRENLEAIQFLQETNATAYRTNPGIVMIAEESTAYPGVSAPTDAGGLGFGLKWNMGWMNDTLQYMAEEPINRRYHHGELTFSLVYAFSEKFVLPLSHDEVVHGKGSLLRKLPGDRWQQLAGLRALFAYQWSHPGKNLIFMGCEFGQEGEWAEGESLNWWQGDTPEHSGVRGLVRQLNAVYREHSALWADDFSHHGFEWLESNDGDHNVLAYLRKDGEKSVAVIINFAGTPHEGYRLGLPHGGEWVETLNTDAVEYGGSGVGNLGRVHAEDVPWHGRSHSVSLRIPPLGAIFLTPAG